MLMHTIAKPGKPRPLVAGWFRPTGDLGRKVSAQGIALAATWPPDGTRKNR